MPDADLHRRLAAAADRRRRAGLPSAHTDAFRLVHDADDRLPGLVLDRYGPVGLLRLRTPHWWEPDAFRRLAEAIAATFPPQAGPSPGLTGFRVVIDERGKHTPRALAELEARLHAVLAEAGAAAPDDPAPFRENGFAFEATFGGFSQGLFLDMRSVRRDLHHRWRGRRIANLFAYTCGFGVVLGERNRVVNVDTSRPALDHGRRHYALNGLPVRDEDFVHTDAFAFLEETLAGSRRWDAIVLDPPVQSRGKKGFSRPFALRRDLGRLVEQALDALAPGGELFVSTNYAALDQDAFRRLMIGIARDRQSWILQQWGPEPDFPTPPPHYHLKTALLGPEPPREPTDRPGTTDRGKASRAPGQPPAPGRSRAPRRRRRGR